MKKMKKIIIAILMLITTTSYANISIDDILGTYIGEETKQTSTWVPAYLESSFIKSGEKILVKLNTSNGTFGCIGEFTGESTYNNNALIVKDKNEYGTCIATIKFNKTGNTITETTNLEGDHCGYYSGASCGFEGVLTKEDPIEHEARVKKEKIEQEKIEAAGDWDYGHTPDEMSNGIKYTASVRDYASLNLDPPYEGYQMPRLIIRNTPKNGDEVMITIDKGQIMCVPYPDCKVSVRFDKGVAEEYSMGESSSHDTTVVFLDDANRFISKMKKSKNVKIAITIYQNGTRVLNFDIHGFDVKRFKSK